jgi:hypothetical protein
VKFEYRSIDFQKISSNLTWLQLLRRKKDCIIDIGECFAWVNRCNYSGQIWESTVFKFHCKAGKAGELFWEIEEMKNDWLIAENVAVGNATGNDVTDLTGSTGDQNAEWGHQKVR